MAHLTLELPEDLLLATGQSREEFLRDVRYLLALKFFEMGRLSAGKAAEMCSMNRVDFLLAAGRAGVPVVHLEEDQMEGEFRDA